MSFVIAFSIIGATASFWIVYANHLVSHWYLFWVPIVLFFAFFAVALFLFLGITILCTLHINVDEPLEKPVPFGVKICQEFAAFIVLISGIRVHVSGMEKIPKDRRFLFVTNHRSNLDPIIAMDKLRSYNIAFVSKPSNMKIPAIGKLIHLWCFLSIDRENARNAIKTIQQAADYIKRDVVSIGIYPEGTRSKSQQMGDFHAGSFKIAQKAGCPLVIGCVRGTETVKYQFWNISHCYVDILDVIPPEKLKNRKSVEIAEETKAMIGAYIRQQGEDPGI